jgi:acetyltransferase
MISSHYLRSMLAPQSVALIGASSRPGSLGRIVYENLLDAEFQGELYAVNPRHATVLGHTAFRSIEAIEKTIDLAVICAPAEAVPSVLRECSGRVRSAVIVSSAPAAGPETYLRWRSDISVAARAANIRMLGPASFGVIRTSIGLNATYGTVPALRGRLTLISQSGAVASALLDFGHGVGIGFASVAVLGAAGDVDFGEIMEFALSDPESDAIVLYVGMLHDARTFLSSLRAAARTKPVVVLRSGREAHKRPPRGNGPPSPDRVFDVALMRAGVVRVHTYTQLFAAATLLAAGRLPRGNRLAIMSNGRGPGLMAADRALDAGIALAKIADETRAVLAPLLPRERTLENPFDLEGEATPAQFASAVPALLADHGVDALLCLHVSTPTAPPTDTARAVATAAKNASKPVLAAWLGSIDRAEPRAALEAGGVINFYTPENAVDAFSFIASYRRNQEWLLEVPPPLPELGVPDIAAALRVRSRAVEGARTTLRPDEAQELLVAFGIASLPCAVARSAQGAQAAARRIGYPVTLQIEDDAAITTSRASLLSAASVRRAFAQLRADGKKRAVVVRKDPGFAPSTAANVGVYSDAVFGPVIAFRNAASTASELSLMLPPLNKRLALDLVGAANGEHTPAELDLLVTLLLRVSALVCAAPWLSELELASVVINSEQTSVVAARIVIDPRRPTSSEGYRHMAIHPYPTELETVLKLNGGVELRVRPIRPEDAAMERAFVDGLSEQSRYLRFMQHLPSLTPQMLARFTQVDYDREVALLALDGAAGAEAIIAVARYIANWDGESAEFAVVVADAWQGRGVGFRLMRILIDCARKRGFKRLMGAVLAINASMLAMVAALGFTAQRDPTDPEQMIVTLDLAAQKT